MRLLPPDTEPSLTTCLLVSIGGLIGVCLLTGSISVLTHQTSWIWRNPEQVPSTANAIAMLGGGVFFLAISIASWFLWGRHEDDGGGEHVGYGKWD